MIKTVRTGNVILIAKVAVQLEEKIRKFIAGNRVPQSEASSTNAKDFKRTVLQMPEI